jgi:hypothetical protein
VEVLGKYSSLVVEICKSKTSVDDSASSGIEDEVASSNDAVMVGVSSSKVIEELVSNGICSEDKVESGSELELVGSTEENEMSTVEIVVGCGRFSDEVVKSCDLDEISALEL